MPEPSTTSTLTSRDWATVTTGELHPVVAHHVVNTLQWRSLRPLQQAAIAPVIRGEDCLLIAPTAGGKTEAAVLPLLTRMQNEGWGGISVLYLCPLKALLNNLQPRLDGYTAWLDAGPRFGMGIPPLPRVERSPRIRRTSC